MMDIMNKIQSFVTDLRKKTRASTLKVLHYVSRKDNINHNLLQIRTNQSLKKMKPQHGIHTS